MEPTEFCIDIDGTLRNFVGSVYSSLKLLEPANVPDGEPLIEEWDISRYYPNVSRFWDKLYLNKNYAREIFLHNQRNLENSDVLIRFLESIEGRRLFLCSHQRCLSTSYTSMWLDEFLSDLMVEPAGILFPNPEIPKTDLLPTSIMIDDNFYEIEKHNVHRSILINQPWNRQFKVPYRLNLNQEPQKFAANLKEIINTIRSRT